MKEKDKNGRYEDGSGNIRWYKDGELHREYGPAVEWKDGSRKWYINGKLHRLNGPATELLNGNKYWYLDGKLHREDGPAIELENGIKSWYLDGVQYTEEQFNQWLAKKELNENFHHTPEEKPSVRKVKI